MRVVLLALVWGCLAPSLAVGQSDRAPVGPRTDLDPQVRRAIDLGRGYVLRAVQGAHRGQGGEQLLALLALSRVGDPADRDALERLASRQTHACDATYDVAVRLLLQETLRCAALEETAKRDARTLIRSQNSEGGWRYGPNASDSDNSCTQYALLGLHAATQLGIEIPKSTWSAAERYLLAQANSDGSTGYTGRRAPTLSMTAGLLSSVQVVQTHLPTPSSRLTKVSAASRQWIFDTLDSDVGRASLAYYTLYGIERSMGYVGDDSGGPVDWYGMGARWLLSQQAAHTGCFGRDGLVESSFALLFLIRRSTLHPAGRTPETPLSQIMARLDPTSDPESLGPLIDRLESRGRPVCVEILPYLGDELFVRRLLADSVLRRVTRGNVGYDPRVSPTTSRAAIQRWTVYVLPDPVSGPSESPRRKLR